MRDRAHRTASSTGQIVCSDSRERNPETAATRSTSAPWAARYMCPRPRFSGAPTHSSSSATTIPGRYWIVKNSFRTGWGVQGFGMISDDANLLEPAGFAGLRDTNPDPWCRRRMRTGALIQGGNGAAREPLRAVRSPRNERRGMNIEHWYRENTTSTFNLEPGSATCARLIRGVTHP